jgi:type I restriction enzyme S subunit
MPADWSTTTLGDCADFFSGGTPRTSNDDYWGGTIPWFSGKDLKSFYLRDSEDHITEKGAEAGSRLMPAGTILLLVRGMTLHNDVPIGVLTREATFNQDIKALRARSGVQQSFLAHWLVSQKPRLLSTVHAAGQRRGRTVE